MENTPTWICPEVRALTAAEQANAERLFADLVSAGEVRPGPVWTAGLELRAALLLLQDDRRFANADNEFWKTKCRSLFLRPALEPIAHSYWRKFPDFTIDEASALRIASALAGHPLVYRKGPALGRSA